MTTKSLDRIENTVGIVCLSTNYAPEITLQIPQARFFPERALSYLQLCRDYSKLIVILPNEVPPDILDYFLNLFFRESEKINLVPKIIFVFATESQTTSLTNRVLKNTRYLSVLQEHTNKKNCNIVNACPYEEDSTLAYHLNGKLEESELDLSQFLGSKYGSKKIFAQSTTNSPDWTGAVYRDPNDIIMSITELMKKHEKVCVKIDSRTVAGGIGNFYFRRKKSGIHPTVKTLESYLYSSLRPFAEFWSMAQQLGCIVEEFIDNIVSFPSALYYISNKGPIFISWQEQIIEESHFSGFILNPNSSNDTAVKESSSRIASTLYEAQYRGTAGIDFIETRDGQLAALEINGRKTGVSHVISFCDGILHKYGRVRDSDTHILYRRGCFAENTEQRNFQNNVQLLQSVNNSINGRKGDGGYFLNYKALSINGFVEYICIASSSEEVKYIDESISSLFHSIT